MTKRIPFWLCVVLSVLTGGIGIQSLRSPLVIYESGRWNNQEHIRFHKGQINIQFLQTQSGTNFQQKHFDFFGVSYLTRQVYIPNRTISLTGPNPPLAMQATKLQQMCRITISLWIPFLLFIFYPLSTFLIVPFRKSYRRSKNLCSICEYQLTGNQSEVCPECGTAIVQWVIPRWERIIISVLCAMIFSLILEFINQRGAMEHRFAIWLIRNFSIEGGSWYITASFRSLIYATAGIGAYYYLSPDRFQDHK